MDIVFLFENERWTKFKWIVKRNDKIFVMLKRTGKNVIKQLENTIDFFTNFFMIDQTNKMVCSRMMNERNDLFTNDERTKWFVRAQSLDRNITISAFTVMAESWPDLAVTT